MIINSNKQRGLVGSEYNTRRQQCEEAANLFGVKALRDITFDEFYRSNIYYRYRCCEPNT